MQHKANHVEQIQPSSVDAYVTQCIKGKEIVSNRDMVAYLRSMHQGAELPPRVDEHIKGCHVCAENWKFTKETDPELRKLREARVQLIIRTVVAEEELPEFAASAGTSLTDEQNRQLVAKLTAGLLLPNHALVNNVVVKRAVELAGNLPNDKEAAYISGKIVEIPARVWAISNREERDQTKNVVCSIFKRRLESQPSYNEAMLNFLAKVEHSNPKLIDLSKVEGVPVDVATALFASAPATFEPPGLFQKKGNKICFNLERFHQCRNNPRETGPFSAGSPF